MTDDQRAGAAVHVLKCWPEYFQAIVDGRKTFEVRKADREFRVGDTLHLREFVPDGSPDYPLGFTDRAVEVTVTYVLREPSPFAFLGFVVMGIRRASDKREGEGAVSDSLARIIGDHIVIRIPVAALGEEYTVPKGLLGSDAKPRFPVVDAPLFARDFVRALNAEDETGETMIHGLFDEAYTRAVEDGAEGLKYE